MTAVRSLDELEAAAPKVAGIRWTGPGATAFALALRLDGTGVPGSAETFRSAPQSSGPLRVRSAAAAVNAATLSGAELAPAADAALRDFFDAGGRECYVLADARFGLAEPWMGDDAGPGSRTGLPALAEVDEVGLVVVPASPSGARFESVGAIAERRPEVFFLLEGDRSEAGARRPRVTLIRPNAAVVDDLAESVGVLAAWLESSDWNEEVSSPPAAPSGLQAKEVAPLVAWRRREGLRRSIDWGTRWVLFEPSHSFLWRGIERDVTAFLYRLERDGFFRVARASGGRSEGGEDRAGEQARARGRSFQVECSPAPRREGDAEAAEDATRVQLRVELGGQEVFEI